MGGAVSSGSSNDDLISKLKQADYIEQYKTEIIMRLIDRSFYILRENASLAYKDSAWRSDFLHLSAPCIYAKVLDGLELCKGQSFLNLGSGTGYLSTMAGLILGSNGTNHGVEITEYAVDYAKDRLQFFFEQHKVLQALDFAEPIFINGNALACKAAIKYDRIYCGAATETHYNSYLRSMLKDGGILVTPQDDHLQRIQKVCDTTFKMESLLPVSFSDMIIPDKEQPISYTMLPLIEPRTLKHMCRQKILSSIRTSFLKDSCDFCHKIVPTVKKIQMCASDLEDESDDQFDAVQATDLLCLTGKNIGDLCVKYMESLRPRSSRDCTSTTEKRHPVQEEMTMGRLVSDSDLSGESDSEGEIYSHVIDTYVQDYATYYADDGAMDTKDITDNETPQEIVYNCMGVAKMGGSHERVDETETALLSFSSKISSAVSTLPLPQSLKRYVIYNQS